MREVVYKGRLNGIQRNRMKSLFDMMYSPRELAEELGISKDQVYMVYVPLGCPHERDLHNHHILINGRAFAEWYGRVYVKLRIGPNEVFCRTCRRAVRIVDPVERTKAGLRYVLSTCPNCGRRLTRIVGSGWESR